MGTSDSEIRPGDSYAVTLDILIDGMLAFKKGEQVVVEGINANPDIPEYEYIVFSQRMQQKYCLQRSNLVPETREQNTGRRAKFCRDCGREAVEQSKYCGRCGGPIIELPASKENTSGTPPAPTASTPAAKDTSDRSERFSDYLAKLGYKFVVAILMSVLAVFLVILLIASLSTSNWTLLKVTLGLLLVPIMYYVALGIFFSEKRKKTLNLVIQRVDPSTLQQMMNQMSAGFVQAGFIPVLQTPFSYAYQRKRQPNVAGGIILLLFCFIVGIIYFLAGESDEVATINIFADPRGHMICVDGPWWFKRYTSDAFRQFRISEDPATDSLRGLYSYVRSM